MVARTIAGAGAVHLLAVTHHLMHAAAVSMLTLLLKHLLSMQVSQDCCLVEQFDQVNEIPSAMPPASLLGSHQQAAKLGSASRPSQESFPYKANCHRESWSSKPGIRASACACCSAYTASRRAYPACLAFGPFFRPTRHMSVKGHVVTHRLFPSFLC